MFCGSVSVFIATVKTLLQEGVPASALDDLTLSARIEQCDIDWGERTSRIKETYHPTRGAGSDETWHVLTRAKCSECGSSIAYCVEAVTDYYPYHGKQCYDYQTDKEGLLPSPDNW